MMRITKQIQVTRKLNKIRREQIKGKTSNKRKKERNKQKKERKDGDTEGNKKNKKNEDVKTTK